MSSSANYSSEHEVHACLSRDPMAAKKRVSLCVHRDNQQTVRASSPSYITPLAELLPFLLLILVAIAGPSFARSLPQSRRLFGRSVVFSSTKIEATEGTRSGGQKNKNKSVAFKLPWRQERASPSQTLISFRQFV